jgi:hypothetical protein
MHVPRSDLSGAAAISRRTFLACSSALALAYVGCAPLTPNTRSAYTLITDPPLDQYSAILGGLIQSILPCEDSEFPLTVDAIRSRLLTLFRLENDPRFLDLQRALVFFDQTDLFTHRLAPVESEAVALDAAARGLDLAATLDQRHAHDARLYARFIATEDAARFARLSIDRQREYLDMWRASGYPTKRQFYASARSLVMISAYSMDSLWTVIRYPGPLLHHDRT